MTIINASDVMTQCKKVKLGDTVIVDNDKQFTLKDVEFNLDINSETNITFVVDWKNGDKTGTDRISANKIKDFLK